MSSTSLAKYPEVLTLPVPAICVQALADRRSGRCPGFSTVRSLQQDPFLLRLGQTLSFLSSLQELRHCPDAVYLDPGPLRFGWQFFDARGRFQDLFRLFILGPRVANEKAGP